MAYFSLTQLLSVSIKYSLLRRGVYYFCRKVPIQFQLEHGKFVRECLHTTDPLQAAKLITRKNRLVEQQWQHIDVESDQEKGIKLLAAYGLKPKTAEDSGPAIDDEIAVDIFTNKLEAKRDAFAGSDEDLHYNAHPSEYLAPAEVEALRMLNEPPRFLLSDAVKVYLARHKKRDNQDFVDDTGKADQCRDCREGCRSRQRARRPHKPD